MAFQTDVSRWSTIFMSLLSSLALGWQPVSEPILLAPSGAATKQKDTIPAPRWYQNRVDGQSFRMLERGSV